MNNFKVQGLLKYFCQQEIECNLKAVQCPKKLINKLTKYHVMIYNRLLLKNRIIGLSKEVDPNAI